MAESPVVSPDDILCKFSSFVGKEFSEADSDFLKSLYNFCDGLRNSHSQLETNFGALKHRFINLQQVNRQLEEAASQNHLIEAKYENLQAEFNLLKDENQKMQNLNKTLKSELSEISTQVKVIEEKTLKLNDQKNQLIEALEEKQVQVDELNVTIHELRLKSVETRHNRSEIDEQIILKNKEITQLNLTCNSVKSQLLQSKDSEKWLNDELERLNRELIALRREKVTESSHSSLKIEELQDKLSSIEAQNRTLLDEFKVKEAKLISVQEAYNKSQIALKEQEAILFEEIASKNRLVETYRANCEEISAKYECLTGQSQDNFSSQELANESLRAELANANSENEALRSRLEELDRFVQTLTVSPTATSARGPNLVEHQHLQNEVLHVKAENERMKLSLQEICRDVDDQVQVLQKEKRDNDRMRMELGSLSQQILSVCQQNERLSEELRDYKEAKVQAESQNSLLCSQIKELRSLLQSVESLGDSSFDKNANVVEILQRRNEELLKQISGLQASLENDSSQEQIRKQLKEALDQIKKLKDQRDRQNGLLEALSRKESVSLINENPKAQILREEQQKVIVDYQSQISQLQRQVNEYSVKIVKTETSFQFLSEKFNLASSTCESQKQEISRLTEKNDQLNRAFYDSQMKLQNTIQEIISAKEAEQRAVSYAQKLGIEISVLRESDSRLQKLYSESTTEKERLVILMNSMQSALVENEQSFNRFRDSSSKTISSLQQKLEQLPRFDETIVAKCELLKNENERLVKENEELAAKIEEKIKSLEDVVNGKLQHGTSISLEDFNVVKAALEQYQTMLNSSQDSYSNLLDSFNSLQSSKDAEILELAKELEESKKSVVKIHSELEDARHECNLTSAKLESLEAEYKSKTSQDLIDAYDQLKALYEKQVKELEELSRNCSQLLDDKENFSESIDKMAKENAFIKSRLDSINTELDLERESKSSLSQNFESRIKELSSQNNELVSQIENLMKGKGLSTIEIGESDDRFGEIIGILKRQKETLQVNFEKNEQELRRLKLRLEQTQRTLDQANSTLEEERKAQGSNQKLKEDYKILKEKFEQLSMLRDGNQNLRAENIRLMSQINQLEREIVSLREANEPVMAQSREMRAELGGKSRHIEILQQEIQDANDRYNQLLAKLDGSVEPQEMDSLRQRTVEVNLEKQALETRIGELETRHKRLLVSLNQLRAENAGLKNQLEDTAGGGNSDEQVSKLKNENKVLASSISKLKSLAAQQEALAKRCQENEERALKEKENLMREYEMKNNLLSQRVQYLKNEISILKVEGPKGALPSTADAFYEEDEEEGEGEEQPDLEPAMSHEQDLVQEEQGHQVGSSEHEEQVDELKIEEIEALSAAENSELDSGHIDSEYLEEAIDELSNGEVDIGDAEEELSEAVPPEALPRVAVVPTPLKVSAAVPEPRKRGVIDLSMLKKTSAATPVAPKPPAAASAVPPTPAPGFRTEKQKTILRRKGGRNPKKPKRDRS